MSKRSVPTPASSQCADEERRGCGTDVPEPSTVSFIIPDSLPPFALRPSLFYRPGALKGLRGRWPSIIAAS